MHPRSDREANTVLVEGIKDGKPGVKYVPPVIVYDELGEYTPVIKEILYGESSEHFFYVLKCSDNSYYGGYTTDVIRREAEHNAELDVNIQKHVAR